MNKQFQYELWRECNNNCTWCYLGSEKFKTEDSLKIRNINHFIENVDRLMFNEEFNNVSLIGGEFFQGQMKNLEVKELFMKAIDKIIEYLSHNEKRSTWITVTLTTEKQPDLYEMLEKLSQSNNKNIWLCTSYDTIGRFHTEQNKLNWENHMRNISKQFPMLKKNTCMILTQDLMEKYINDEMDFKLFKESFGTQLFLKPPDRGSLKNKEEMMNKIPNFFPKRETTLEFLVKLMNEDFELTHGLMNVNLRADVTINNYNDGSRYDSQRNKNKINEYDNDSHEYELKEEFNLTLESNTCGHSTYYQCYEDSDDCILCDIIRLKTSMM